MKKSFTYATALIIACSSASVSAQGEAKKEKNPAAKTEKKEGGKKKEAKKADIEINIMADTLAYDTAEFSVKEGQTVKLNLESKSALPKAAGGHNLLILTKGTDVAKFATSPKIMGAAATEYIPTDAALKKKILAHTKLLGPKEKDSITFTAPAEGTYDYICTFPGHFAVMKGKMKVAAKGGDDKKKDGDGKKDAPKKSKEKKK